MRKTGGIVAALLSACLASAQALVNGGFEDAADGKVKGWHAYGTYACETEVVQAGARALRCEVPEAGKGQAGVMQEIVYARPDRAPVVFGGWSKAERVAAEDYCIYLDIWYEGGGNAWGVTANWSQPTHDWEYAAEIFYPEKPVQKIQYFVFLRKGAGKVWFDALSLERRQPVLGLKKMRAFSDFPATQAGVQVSLEFWKGAAWRCRALNADGRERESFSGNGSRAVMTVAGGTSVALHISAKAGSETFEQTCALPTFPRTRDNPAKGGCAVWTADSMRCVTPLTYPSRDELASPRIALELARNERESAQLLITAGDAGPVEDVTVELAPLARVDGLRFDGELTWQRVGYIRRQRPYHPHPCGVPADENWMPDPLLPPAPLTVRASATQGLWLTAAAGDGAKPGVYSGQVILKAGGRPLRNVPVTLRVRDFANPKTFGMPTAFCVMDGFTKAQYPGRFEEMKRKSHDLMLDHRLNPDDISRTEPPRIEDLLHARERGMNRFNILNLVPKPARPGKWVCFSPLSAYTPAFYEELKARLTPVVAELRKHGLEKSAYLYGFDERPYEYYPAIGELWRKLRADFPDIPVMTTAMMYRDMRDGKTYPEQDITDWFCPLTSVYDPELSAKLRAQGRQVWWYVCCGPTWPQANFASFEYPPVEGRLLGWLTYRYRSDGLLFWHVNLWPDRPPLKTDDTFLSAWEAEISLRMPGDGQLLYPGADGPLPSIRLANVRDGIEDYEWLMLLAQKKDRAAAEAMTAELIRSMTDFERSPDALRRTRARIADALEGRDSPLAYDVDLKVISEGWDGTYCWFHPHAGAIPENPPYILMTLQKFLAARSDVFMPVETWLSRDFGKSWKTLPGSEAALGRHALPAGIEEGICDFMPKWHAKSGRLLGTGHSVQYKDNRLVGVRPRSTVWSVYSRETEKWSPWQALKMPDDPKFGNAGAGYAQRVDLPDGDILLPIYFKAIPEKKCSAAVARCRFDGTNLTYVAHGNEMTVDVARGFVEPSLARFGSKYYLTLRNDAAAYVAASDDGLHFDAPVKWRFDDGAELGSYNTQAHWVTHDKGLLLCYTRRGAGNDHVIRHRAPLFIAQVDPERRVVLRATERVLVPNKGAQLGNFSVTDVNENESWVTTSEGMAPPGAEKYGADGRVYVARLLWKTPNAGWNKR